jgi:chemotaxis protein MotB
MIGIAKRKQQSVSVWPGYVDVLSALLMVVIFVLLIFVIAQFLLSEILTGQESELSSLHRQVAELTRLLGLEQEKNRQLSATAVELSTLISSLTENKRELTTQIEALTRQSAKDRAEIQEYLLVMASLQEDIDALRHMRQELEAKVGNLAAALESSLIEAGSLRDRSKALEARLADETERTLLAQKKIEDSDIRIQALTAVVGNQKRALEESQEMTADAKAEVVLLGEQIAALKRQLEKISLALKLAEKEKKAQAVEIKDLGKRLNIALAQRVNELEKYRSDFFGRLKAAIGTNPHIRIVGDRFVFQAELLFESGSAQLGDEGKQHLTKLATTLGDLSTQIPIDINWILRIDGHTDRVPIHTQVFASNWELSTARAVSVVNFLAKQGIPESRMAATGFSKFHPLDPSDTTEAYRKNRRIEIKLTAR